MSPIGYWFLSQAEFHANGFLTLFSCGLIWTLSGDDMKYLVQVMNTSHFGVL
jgi:hypothetical protein